MFESKTKIGLREFMNEHYLPLIDKMIDSEADLLQIEIDKNSPPILLSKDRTRFELFILFSDVIGHSLGKVMPFDPQIAGQQILFFDQLLTSRFPHVQLDPVWIKREGRAMFSDQCLYYMHKVPEYDKNDQLFSQGKLSKQQFQSAISQIFLSVDSAKINESLTIAIREISNGGLVYAHQYLAPLARKYRVVPDKMH